MITEGYLLRHCNGKSVFRDAALIDVAQDHALWILHEKGMFDLGLVFKGGTALRKYHMGNAGRSSTDLDFASAEAAVADLVFETLHGARCGGFSFRVEMVVDHRRAILHIDSNLGSPSVPARIDITDKKPWLTPEPAALLPLPIHARYEFILPPTPIMDVEEMLAEKLARYRRASLARDLYDLAWFARQAFDERLLRRLSVLKVWGDVVQDGLGTRPFLPGDITRMRKSNEFDSDAIGYLAMPIDITRWVDVVISRYAFIHILDSDEIRFAQCNPGDAYRVHLAIQSLSDLLRVE